MRQLFLFAILSIGALAEEAFDGKYTPPKCDKCLFLETFEETSWVHSKNDKYNGKTTITLRETKSVAQDHGLMLPTSHRFYGISKALPNAVENESGFVVQYEVALRDRLECGGAYLKLLTASESFDPEQLHDQSPYTIMFGPDKCGSTNKIHVIFRHKNPITGEIEEKHLKSPPSFPNDRVSHVYTLVVTPDNKYEVRVDGDVKKEGSLFEDFEPPFQPPKTIADKTDTKPLSWVDAARIPDPTSTKPDDWDEDAPAMIDDESAEKPSGWLDDEPELIPDPSAEMPSDWDPEEDGDFEPPLIKNPRCTVGCGVWKRPQIRNPAFKGKWSPNMIPNPDYKGEWKPRQIDNPAYYEEKHPARFSPIGALAFELWTTNRDILFDNVLLARTYDTAREFAEKTWRLHYEEQKAEEDARKHKEAMEQSSPLDPVLNLLPPELAEFVRENSIAVAVVVVVVVGVCVLMCCSGGGDAADVTQAQPTRVIPQAHKKDDDVHVPEDEAEEEEEEGEEQEEEEVAPKAETKPGKITKVDEAKETKAKAKDVETKPSKTQETKPKETETKAKHAKEPETKEVEVTPKVAEVTKAKEPVVVAEPVVAAEPEAENEASSAPRQRTSKKRKD